MKGRVSDPKESATSPNFQRRNLRSSYHSKQPHLSHSPATRSTTHRQQTRRRPDSLFPGLGSGGVGHPPRRPTKVLSSYSVRNGLVSPSSLSLPPSRPTSQSEWKSHPLTVPAGPNNQTPTPAPPSKKDANGRTHVWKLGFMFTDVVKRDWGRGGGIGPQGQGETT